ncbi:uncharacterized protein LOC132061293 [Lycium ferocissimum]|uniref:uncharacterized protein LOC132061293 n=1 Tax=Lycium ferocissimum TaxID=112874 RepID=UPI00281565BF|nr:uncharacterized protein LOC132061293 [Lycium ferocissimum]
MRQMVEESVEDKVTSEGEEDTLSLCDLPIYSNSFDVEELQHNCSTIISPTEFEFFSEELTKNHLPENIIFCGKLIPSRKPNISEQNPRKQKKWYSHFQCIISLPFYKTKSNSSRKRDSVALSMKEQVSNVSATSDNKIMSSLSSSSSGRSRSRWYLFLFGISKLPSHHHEMDLSDLRNRSSRRQIKSSISSSSSLSIENGDGDGGRDFWWVVRGLSCGGSHHAQAMVNASIGCLNITKM